jgi:hypothetical protein
MEDPFGGLERDSMRVTYLLAGRSQSCTSNHICFLFDD